MKRNQLLMTAGGGSYRQKIIATRPILYLPLGEPAGTVAQNYGTLGSAANGTYVGVTLAQIAAPGGGMAPAFDGANGYVNIYSAALNAAWPAAVGSWAALWRVSGVGDWSDATLRTILRIGRDPAVATYVGGHKSASNGVFADYVAWGGVSQTVQTSRINADWNLSVVTWNNVSNAIKTYRNRNQYGPSLTNVGSWSGAIDSTICNIGCLDNDPLTSPWKGYIAHTLVYDRELSAADVRNLFNWVYPNRRAITGLGDSITANAGSWLRLLESYDNFYITNRAVASHNIISNMDGQTLAAVNDGADIIIIALGTNDNDAGDMGVLQAEAEENIAELKASNPSAAIYWLNVLPKWTDVGGGTEVDKSNIRAAIAAACAAQNIVCWDTYTTPWIVAADTSDGVHPTAGGSAKILAQVLTRI